MKIGKRHFIEGMNLQTQEIIKTLWGKENYEYFWIVKAVPIKQAEMKKTVRILPQKNEKTAQNEVF